MGVWSVGLYFDEEGSERARAKFLALDDETFMLGEHAPDDMRVAR